MVEKQNYSYFQVTIHLSNTNYASFIQFLLSDPEDGAFKRIQHDS